MFLFLIVTLIPRCLSRPCDLDFHLAREIDLGEANVPVIVSLDVGKFCQLVRIEDVDQPFSQDGDPEMKPLRAPFDNRSLDDVAELRERNGRRANSSRMRVKVAPAALPIPSARWPACRPIATTTYQRRVERASSDQTLHQFDPDVTRRLKAESRDMRRQRQIIVDRLRDVDCPNVGRGRDRARRQRRVVAADRDQMGHAELFERFHDGAHRLHGFGRIFARRAEHRAAAQMNA